MNGFLDGGMMHEGDDCEADAAQQQHAHQHQQDHHLLLVSLGPPLRQLQLLNHRLELELSTNPREVSQCLEKGPTTASSLLKMPTSKDPYSCWLCGQAS